MIEKYDRILQQHAAEVILVYDELYDYREKTTPEIVYDRIYEMADNHLQEQGSAIGLPSPTLVFDKDSDPSGTARLTQEMALVKLSYNIIEMQLPLFGPMDEVITQYISEDIHHAIANSNMSMAELLVQNTAMVQYYHEFAHLVQDKGKVSTEYQPSPRPEQLSGEVPWSHAREIDADWMSMDQLVKNIVSSYIDDKGEWKKGNIAELEGELSVALTSTICFFLRATPAGEIYYSERTHPHPLIRLELILRNLGIALRKYLPESLPINEAKVVEDAYRFAEGLFENDATALNLEENFVLQVKEEVKANLEPINSYIDQMLELASTMEELCMNQEQSTINTASLTKPLIKDNSNPTSIDNV